MATTAKPVSTTIVNYVLPPLNVNAVSPTGRWRITSNWDDELAEKVVNFLKSNSFEFYSTGNAPSDEAARKRVKSARDRVEANVPFTPFPVLDASGNVIGEFAIGFDDDPRKLQIAGRGVKAFHDKGIAREILEWCFTKYIPELRQKGVLFPVYAKDQDDVAWKDKKVVEWLDLKDVSVVATVHPDYAHCNNLLSKSGFTLISQKQLPKFVGVHDGRRNVYEFALSKLFDKKDLK